MSLVTPNNISQEMPPKTTGSGLIEGPVFPDYPELAKQFHENGYVVIEGIIPREECKQIIGLFWDFIEGLNPNLSRRDQTNWMDPFEWPINTRGLIQHYNVGFQKFTVKARNYVKNAFAMLYGTDELISSFDGVSFSKRPKMYKFQNIEDWHKKKWDKDEVHVDQTHKGFRCVQGGAAIVNQFEEGHVFVCIPGSHLHHDELVDRIAENAPKVLNEDWYKIDGSDKTWIKKKGLDIMRVPMKSGSVILWDSRLIHSSTSWCRSSTQKMFIPYRLQIFVCMKPADCLTEVDKVKRNKAYIEGRTSRHIPDNITLFGKNPRMYGPVSNYAKLKVPKSCELTDDEKKLYGLIDYSSVDAEEIDEMEIED